MGIDIYFIEVDGSLANPLVAVVVGVWSIGLSVLTIATIRAAATSVLAAALKGAPLAACMLSTPWTQRLIGKFQRGANAMLRAGRPRLA